MNFFKILTLTFSILCIYFQHQAIAGGSETGNGGGAWVCQLDSGEVIEWIRLVDLYEATNEFHLNIPSANQSLNYLDIIDLKMARLSRSQSYFSQKILPRLSKVINSLVFVNADLKIIEDSLYRIIPSKNTCSNGRIQYVQLANYTNYNKVLIQNSIWNHPKFSETDKAALILHEAIYLYCREKLGDTTSNRSRQIIGLIFSDLEEKKLGQKLEELLKTKDSTSKPSHQQKYFEVGEYINETSIIGWGLTCGFVEKFFVLNGNEQKGWKIQAGRIHDQTALRHKCALSSTIINVNKKIAKNTWVGESQLQINHSNSLTCTYKVTFQVTFDTKIDENNNHFSLANVKINYPVILSNSETCFADSRGDYFTTESEFTL